MVDKVYVRVGNQTARDSMKGRKQTRLQRQVGMAVEILLGLPGDGEDKNKKRSRSAKKARDILKKRKTVIHLRYTAYSTPQQLAIGDWLLQTIIPSPIHEIHEL